MSLTVSKEFLHRKDQFKQNQKAKNHMLRENIASRITKVCSSLTKNSYLIKFDKRNLVREGLTTWWRNGERLK